MATERQDEDRQENPEDWRPIQSLRENDAVVVRSAETTDELWQDSGRMADRLRTALVEPE